MNVQFDCSRVIIIPLVELLSELDYSSPSHDPSSILFPSTILLIGFRDVRDSRNLYFLKCSLEVTEDSLYLVPTDSRSTDFDLIVLSGSLTDIEERVVNFVSSRCRKRAV